MSYTQAVGMTMPLEGGIPKKLAICSSFKTLGQSRSLTLQSLVWPEQPDYPIHGIYRIFDGISLRLYSSLLLRPQSREQQRSL